MKKKNGTRFVKSRRAAKDLFKVSPKEFGEAASKAAFEELAGRVRQAEQDAKLRYRQAIVAGAENLALLKQVRDLQEDVERLKKLLDPTHTTAKGRVMRTKDFRNGHLVNLIRCIERNYAKFLEPTMHDVEGFHDVQAVAFTGNDHAAKEGTVDGTSYRYVKPIADVYPIYPHLVAEARLRGLKLENDNSYTNPNGVSFPHVGLKTTGGNLKSSRTGERRRYFVYLPDEVEIDEDLYWDINDTVSEDGYCTLRLHVDHTVHGANR